MALNAAVAAVWASLYSRRAVLSRRAAGVGQAAAAMAVLLMVREAGPPQHVRARLLRAAAWRVCRTVAWHVAEAPCPCPCPPWHLRAQILGQRETLTCLQELAEPEVSFVLHTARPSDGNIDVLLAEMAPGQVTLEG